MDGQRCANTMRRHRHPPQLRDNRFMFCRPLIFHSRSEDFLRKSEAFDKIINDINGMQRERRREGLCRRDLSCFVEWCEATRRSRGETLLIIRLTSCSINFRTQLSLSSSRTNSYLLLCRHQRTSNLRKSQCRSTTVFLR